MKLLVLQIIVIVGLVLLGRFSSEIDLWIKPNLYHFIKTKAQESEAMVQKLNRLTNQSFSGRSLSSNDAQKEFLSTRGNRSQDYSYVECHGIINYFENRGKESRRLLDSVQQEYQWRVISEQVDYPWEKEQWFLIQDEPAEAYEWHFVEGNVMLGKEIEITATRMNQLERIIIKTDKSQTVFSGSL